MRTFVTVALLAVLASAAHPVRQELVEEIKLKADSWTPKEAHLNHLRHIPEERVKGTTGSLGTSYGHGLFKGLGTFFNGISSVFAGHGASLDDHKFLKLKDSGSMPADAARDLPVFFSWRKKMPECVGPIEDQGECGACWAFSSAGVLSDRLCIHSKGEVKQRLAPQELVNCNYENYGCEGGYLMSSMDYLMTEGSVNQKCMPYVGTTETCTYRCADGTMDDFQRYYCKPGTLTISTTYDEIKRDLMDNGPVMVGLTMYEDFMNYESGIYRYAAGQEVGGHAMKLIGWGYDDQLGLYWELQNQWTTDWGEEGFVKILHGEIGIDSISISCGPDLI
jgi:cathepsin B